MPIKKPMLSGTALPEQLDEIQWPVLCSPKLDGIRCLLHPELGPVTRSFKPIANTHIRVLLGDERLECLDGEIIALDPETGAELDFNQTQSAVMSRSGEPKFMFYAFDNFFAPEEPYYKRIMTMFHKVRTSGFNFVEGLFHHRLYSEQAFVEYHTKNVRAGFEGTMIRHEDGPYKNGRSTFRQGWLLKYKDVHDAEGTVVGFEELMHNDNPDEKDEFGYAKRSSAKAGLKGAATLGALVLETAWGILQVGTGFDARQRQEIWDNRDAFLHKQVTFKYQAHGMQDLPRFPVFKAFREEE